MSQEIFKIGDKVKLKQPHPKLLGDEGDWGPMRVKRLMSNGLVETERMDADGEVWTAVFRPSLLEFITEQM